MIKAFINMNLKKINFEENIKKSVKIMIKKFK